MGFRTRAICIRETEKAILVELPDLEDDPVWIPQSQITDDSNVWKDGQDDEIDITEWFAEKKGWL